MNREPLFFFFFAVVGAAAFAVVFRTPRRYFALTVLIGAGSVTMQRLMPAGLGLSFSSFLTALAVGCLSHGAARLTRAPAQCFLIPGIILLVPGTYIYRAVSAALDNRTREALPLALAAVAITFGISFGILLANWLLPSRKAL